MPKKYTTEIFEEKVKNIKDWFLELAEEYSSKNEEILVRCKNGHEFLANTKALVRNDKLKECPICQEINKERFCLYCGKKLEKNQFKFCSSSHSAKFNNTQRKKIKLCLNCGKELNVKHRLYCSNKCQKEYQYLETIKKWKNKEIIFSEKQISHHIREYLFRKYDNKCCKCGWSQKNLITNKIPLEVHHIDGDYKNNDETNLELLCPNCHSLTSTFGSLNKGKGRKSH